MKSSVRSTLLCYTALSVSLLAGCTSPGSSGEKRLPNSPDTGVNNSAKDTVSADDESKFLSAFAKFQQAVTTNRPEAVAKCIHFPFQTTPMWFNEDLRTRQINKYEGLISYNEFGKYYPDIFHTDVKHLLPHAGDEALHEIDEDTDQDYYKVLRQPTDKGAKLYEAYFQYPTSGTNSESFFAFVFGRIGGEYKAIAYYAKWPVKG